VVSSLCPISFSTPASLRLVHNTVAVLLCALGCWMSSAVYQGWSSMSCRACQ